MKATICLCLLLAGHFLGMRHVFAALEYLDGALKAAYAAAHPELQRMQELARREYQEARRDSRH